MGLCMAGWVQFSKEKGKSKKRFNIMFRMSHKRTTRVLAKGF